MTEPIVDMMSTFAPNLMLILVVMVPILVIAMLGFLFIISRFDAYVQVEYGYETTNDVKMLKVKFSKDRMFLKSKSLFGKGALGGPLAVSGKPTHYKGKPLYRYYSPEPMIFIPIELGLKRKVTIKTPEGEKEFLVEDLIPSIGFEAKQAFTESYQEADKLFQERNKLLQIAMVWAGPIVITMLMLIIIIQLSSLASGLTHGIAVTCSTTDAAKAVATTVPFMV